MPSTVKIQNIKFKSIKTTVSEVHIIETRAIFLNLRKYKCYKYRCNKL